MPKSPTGAPRPSDVIGNAVHVMKVLTGEIADSLDGAPEIKDPHAVALGRRGGRAGGARRAAALDPARRKEIAKIAASARWKRDD